MSEAREELIDLAGAQGIIYKSTYNGTPCIIKQFKDCREAYLIEKELMTKMSGYICVDIYSSDDEKKEICMELAQYGTLLDYAKSHVLAINKIINIIEQLISLISSMHAMTGFVHRDIKPENILITSLEPFIIKLADFALACKIGDRTYPLGTINYMSKTLKGTTSHVYTGQEDFYSVAIIFGKLLMRNGVDPSKLVCDGQNVYKIIKRGTMEDLLWAMGAVSEVIISGDD